jgi:tetratricopeptide (TPR) repeat protein
VAFSAGAPICPRDGAAPGNYGLLGQPSRQRHGGEARPSLADGLSGVFFSRAFTNLASDAQPLLSMRYTAKGKVAWRRRFGRGCVYSYFGPMDLRQREDSWMVAQNLPFRFVKDGIQAAVREGLLKSSVVERRLREFVNDPANAYVSAEGRLNAFGYRLLNDGRTEEAIEMFKLNTKMYPESWNSYDSLGEAYLRAGKTDLAIINYQKSVELNPRNAAGVEVLRKLRGK